MKHSQNLGKVLLISLISISMSCAKKSADSNSTNSDPVVDAVESAVNSVAGAADDAASETVIAQYGKTQASPFLLFIEKAYAASCARTWSGSAGGTSCSRTVNCETGPYSWSGTVTISKPAGLACTNLQGLANSESITRTADFVRSGPRGQIETKSSNHTNYLGSVIGGGSTVTRITSTEVRMTINGVSKIITRANGSTLMDVSLRSESGQPLVMNQLARNGRVVQSGVVNVDHNVAQFTAQHSFNNVSYQAGCCTPTSGQITTVFSGSKTGIATVTFLGCGQGTYEKDGNQTSFSMDNCE